jgi:hypothetical protein
MRSMEVVGDGAGAGAGLEGSEGAHFCSHGAPVVGACGATRLPPEEEGEAAEAAWREERKRRGRRRWR